MHIRTKRTKVMKDDNTMAYQNNSFITPMIYLCLLCGFIEPGWLTGKLVDFKFKESADLSYSINVNQSHGAIQSVLLSHIFEWMP